MSWSGGVYTRGYASWVTDANNSLPISASKFDTEDNDFAAGLNNCLTIDGLNKPNATLNWAVQMNWTRGTDGNIWSLARTGGVNNPKLQGSVTDASGVTLTATGGTLTVTSASGITVSATDTTARGVAICKFKGADTNRATATMTNDPDLTYAVPGVGTYAVKVLAQLVGAASNTGIQANVNYSGTFNVKSQGYILNAYNSSFHTIAASGIQIGLTTPNTAGAALATSVGDFILFDGVLISTGAGTLGFSWAQNTSSANNTTVQAGSYMTVMQLS